MNIFREELERFIAEAGDTPEDRKAADVAGQLLIEMIRLEGRAARLLTTHRRSHASGEAESLAGLPLHEAARRVLQDAGRPLHVQELGKRIKARGWSHPRAKHAPEARIYFQLAAQLPPRPAFVRVAPNTFGLREWKEHPRPGDVKPRLPLYAGGRSEPVGREIGESPDRPFEDEGSRWRSS